MHVFTAGDRHTELWLCCLEAALPFGLGPRGGNNRDRFASDLTQGQLCANKHQKWSNTVVIHSVWPFLVFIRLLVASYSTEIQMICLKYINTQSASACQLLDPMHWNVCCVQPVFHLQMHISLSHFHAFNIMYIIIGNVCVQLGNDLPSMAHVSYVKSIHKKRGGGGVNLWHHVTKPTDQLLINYSNKWMKIGLVSQHTEWVPIEIYV